TQLHDARLVVHHERAPAEAVNARGHRGGHALLRLRRRGGGQLDGEDRPSRFALAGETTTVLLHNAVGDGQPECGAFTHLLRGEEGLEDARHDLRRNAGTVVLELDHDPAAPAFDACASASANGVALARGEDGMLGVKEEIEDPLLELVDVAFRGRQVGRVVGNDADPRQAQSCRSESHRLLDDRRQIHWRALRLALTREEQETLDDLGHPLPLGHDQVDGSTQLRGQDLALEELTVADDYGERVVELVGHAGHELADRGELARLYQLRLRLLELAHSPGELVAEAAVLDGWRSRRGESGEAVEVLGDEAAILVTHVGDGESADGLATDEERIGDGGPHRLRALGVEGTLHAARPRGVV